MKAKILINDPSGRFKSGDIGEIVELNEHDFDKYEYRLDLPDGRSYFFYKGELEIIEDMKEKTE